MSVSVDAALFLEMQWMCLMRSNAETTSLTKDVDRFVADEASKTIARNLLNEKMICVCEMALNLLEMAFANEPDLRTQNSLRLHQCALIICNFTDKRFSWT